MSRTNISILLATALLGVLLWIVISIVKDVARAPDEPLPMPDESAAPVFDPDLPRISTHNEFVSWLNDLGQPGEQLVEQFRQWLQLQGFPNGPVVGRWDNWIHSHDNFSELGTTNDSELILAAGQGSSSAAELLAERSLNSDPLAALEWYDQAIINGSVHAMVRVSDLLMTLSSPELESFVSDLNWEMALLKINRDSPAPLERALAWAIAAVIVSGYGILDDNHAARIATLSEQLDAAELERACSTAQDYVLETVTVRRRQGGALFSTEPPPLAVSVAEPATAMPCKVPVMPLVSMAGCTHHTFVGIGPQRMFAWLCPTND